MDLLWFDSINMEKMFISLLTTDFHLLEVINGFSVDAKTKKKFSQTFWKKLMLNFMEAIKI